MWTQAKSNRIIYEREKVKDHVLHMERLRAIKPTIQIARPKKPSHLKTNAKREMQNLERMSEIQYQNRILLRKMLQIDLKKSNNTGLQSSVFEKPESNPNGLNSYNSLNRAVRIKEIARVADDNKSILNRLQKTKSHYSSDLWDKQFDAQRKNLNQINENGDRFCKNPYFLHSVCTQQDSISQMPYISASHTNIHQSSRRSARSSNRRGVKAPRSVATMDYMEGQYQYNSARPLSAPKAGGGRKKRMSSAKRPRVHSGRVKQIKKYLSEQEAAHMAIQQQLMGQQMQQENIEEEENNIMEEQKEGEEPLYQHEMGRQDVQEEAQSEDEEEEQQNQHE